MSAANRLRNHTGRPISSSPATQPWGNYRAAAVQHLQGQFVPRAVPAVLGDAAPLPALPVLGPLAGQVEPEVDQGVVPVADITEVDADLAGVDLAEPPVEAEQVKLVDEYTALMVEKAVAVVGESLANLAPASLRIGEGKATFAVNRRNNREADVPAMLAKGKPLAGPVDHTVPVMTVTRPDGSLVADPLRLRVPPDDAQLHDLVRRLPGLRPARAGTGPSGGDGHVRQHLRGRPEPAAAAECRALPALRTHAGDRGRGGHEATAEAGLVVSPRRRSSMSSSRT